MFLFGLFFSFLPTFFGGEEEESERATGSVSLFLFLSSTYFELGSPRCFSEPSHSACKEKKRKSLCKDERTVLVVPVAVNVSNLCSNKWKLVGMAYP